MHVDIKLLTIDSRIHILFKCALGSEGLEFLILQGIQQVHHGHSNGFIKLLAVSSAWNFGFVLFRD